MANREQEFEGMLETHITVSIPGNHALSELREWAGERSLKLLLIELARGMHCSQPMVTRRATGTLSSELKWAGRARSELESRGMPVIRTKIEASPVNMDVPQTDAEAMQLGCGRYFEHHIKLQLDSINDVESLIEIARRHVAHVSRNALKSLNDGREVRFVTQRIYSAGRLRASEELQRLLSEIMKANFIVLDSEQEFVIYDDAVALDAGWLEDLHESGAP